MNLSFTKQGFRLDGKDAFMVSGEFHYFRVPHTDWKRRMELFKQAGGNVIATYVPWLIHEPEEGTILFGDVPNRDLRAFLETAREVGLGVVLRPGPYQYSELINDGLPEWLVRDYPEILAKNPAGEAFRYSSVSYLNPTFLQKARPYFRAFAEVVREFMGDPVVMLQVDNEATGIHIWFGSLDYNPETMGFGRPDGRYPLWLRAKYGAIDALNAAYGTAYSDFTELPIPDPAGMHRTCSKDARKLRDYQNFYYDTIGEYLTLLTSWLREDGLGVPICHNAASPDAAACFVKTAEKMGDDFLLGTDHYYTLNQTWKQNNPTPQHAIRCFVSLETLRLMGMPPAVLEMPGGCPSDTPPMLPEDLLAWYRTHLAFGMKGVNYYIYTGGPNFPGTGSTADVYDYNALVRADGSLNATYAAARDVGCFMAEHPWLQRAERKSSVAVGYDWENLYAHEYAPCGGTGEPACKFLHKGVVHTLFCSRYAPELALLSGDLNPEKPLIVPTDRYMAAATQQKLVEFVKSGGKLMLLGPVPVMDEAFMPCTLLRDYMGIGESEAPPASDKPVTFRDGGKLYQVRVVERLSSLPKDCCCLAQDGQTGKPVGLEKRDGGMLIWLGLQWDMCLFAQAERMELLLDALGAVPTAAVSNRNLFTSLLEAPDGRQMLFVMNLYSGAQSTDIVLYRGTEARSLGRVDLKAMEVRILELE